MAKLRRLDLILAAIATARAGWDLMHASAWTVDDAFIVARYAENLVHHGVLSFNLTGPRVEGFTSPLFAAVACLATALKSSPIAAMRALGVIALLAQPAAVVALGRSLRAHPLATGAAALLFTGMAEHVTHALSGLETEVFVLMSLLAIAAFVSALRFSPRRLWRFSVALGLLSITRPEGIAISAILIAALMLRFRTATAAERSVLLRTLGLGFVVPLAVLTLGRLAYFGALLPNTYYAKAGQFNLRYATEAWQLVFGYFGDAALLAAAILAARFAARQRRSRLRPSEGYALGVSIAVLLACGAAYSVTDLVMNYGYRFAMHTMPWLLVPVLLLMSRAARSLDRFAGGRALVAWAAVMAFGVVVSSIVRVAATSEKLSSYRHAYGQVIERIHRPAAHWIETNTEPSAKLAVYPDAGFIPYRTGRFTLDFGKLNDAYLARHAKRADDVVRYFFEQAPDVLVVARNADGKLWDAGATALLESPEFVRTYEPVERYGDPRGATLSVYARKR